METSSQLSQRALFAQVADTATHADRVPPSLAKRALDSMLECRGMTVAPGIGVSRDHRKLAAFDLADRLAVSVYAATTRFPSSERYGLQSQLRRAAVSVPTNIVEGCARDSEGDYFRFLDIALGSNREVVYLASLAKRLGIMDEAAWREIDDCGGRCAAALSGIRRAIRGA